MSSKLYENDGSETDEGFRMSQIRRKSPCTLPGTWLLARILSQDLPMNGK